MLTWVTQRVLTTSALLILSLLSFSALEAQSESSLKTYFEGSEVMLKIDMPAHKSGVLMSTRGLPRHWTFQRSASAFGSTAPPSGAATL